MFLYFMKLVQRVRGEKKKQKLNFKKGFVNTENVFPSLLEQYERRRGVVNEKSIQKKHKRKSFLFESSGDDFNVKQLFQSVSEENQE